MVNQSYCTDQQIILPIIMHNLLIKNYFNISLIIKLTLVLKLVNYGLLFTYCRKFLKALNKI
jgi:hypothetical protein